MITGRRFKVQYLRLCVSIDLDVSRPSRCAIGCSSKRDITLTTAPWLRAIALLEHLIEESERPMARRLFHNIGKRCHGTALRQMHLQRRRLLEESVLLQLSLASADVVNAKDALKMEDDLPKDFLEVAAAFLVLAQTVETVHPRFKAWLEKRAYLHREHSMLLQSIS